MTWGVGSALLLLVLAIHVGWRFPLFDLLLSIIAVIPMMMGIREPLNLAILALGLLALPPLLSGWKAVSALRTGRIPVSARVRTMAWSGLMVGALFLLCAAILPIPRFARIFDALYGRVLVHSAVAQGDFDTGNRIHNGNLLLGRSALRAGRREEARAYLLAAGRTPGSPQLDSFGPSMALAKEMLETGEGETVIQYLDLCHRFWKMDGGRLEHWSDEIRQGRIPNFEQWGSW
jgi:hypothetical protein